MDAMSPPSGWARAWRAAGFFRRHRRSAAAIALLTLVVAAANAIEPLLLKYIFDGLSSGGTRHALSVGLACLAGLGLVRELVMAQADTLTWRTRLAVHHQVLEAVVGRLHRLPVSFYRSEGVGAIMTRLDRSVQGVVDAASQLAFNVLPAAVFLVFAVAVMVRLEWRLALVVLAFAPLPPLVAAWAAQEQTARQRTLLERWMKIYSRFNEVLTGIVTVKSFTREDEEKRRFIRDVADANQVVVSGVRFDSSVQAGQNLLVTAARVSALGFGGVLVMRGEITVGTLVAFLGYVSGLFGPVQGLSGIYRTLRMASVSIESIYSILDMKDLLGDAPDAREVHSLRGDVCFENVHFSYAPNDRRRVLSGVQLMIHAGETVALVGPSGSGKSTLVALLQRFYDPLEGRVLVDGLDIRTLKQASLRRQIGVVMQDSLLFDDSVASNIAYARPEASRAEVEAAARAANAHDFILGLPEGYDTFVGERGSRLSAGERQRVAIARVLLKNPPIVALDEATSSLDAESEAEVQDALDRLLEGRTTLVIAHRLATVVHADRVCVLQGGHIVECGSHAELVRSSTYYASLVRKQTRGLLPDLPPLEHPLRRAEDRARFGAPAAD
jgi:ATP-binding cassette subfamily B protein